MLTVLAIVVIVVLLSGAALMICGPGETWPRQGHAHKSFFSSTDRSIRG